MAGFAVSTEDQVSCNANPRSVQRREALGPTEPRILGLRAHGRHELAIAVDVHEGHTPIIEPAECR